MGAQLPWIEQKYKITPEWDIKTKKLAKYPENTEMREEMWSVYFRGTWIEVHLEKNGHMEKTLEDIHCRVLCERLHEVITMVPSGLAIH